MVFMTGTLLDRNKTPGQMEERRGTSFNLISQIHNNYYKTLSNFAYEMRERESGTFLGGEEEKQQISDASKDPLV